MGAQVVDYRVSTLVVLCKDCGHDVGLYPSRHKCQTNVSLPPVPSIPNRFAESSESLQVPRKSIHSPEASSNNGSYSRPTSSASSSSFSSVSTPNFSDSTTTSSPASSKWSRFGQRNKQPEDQQQQQQQQDDESIYFNNFAAHLPEEERQGRKLWGKVRQNEKWKQMTEKNDTPKPSGKLWGKLLSATQNISDKMPSRDDKGPESDESDWEGESHVSRALREYYEKKRRPLPNWLRDERTPSATNYREPINDQRQYNNHSGRMNHDSAPHQDDAPKTSSRRRLWDHSQEPSNRERERQELRQRPSPEDNISNSHRQRQYRTQNRDDFDHYDTSPVSSSYTTTQQSLRSRSGHADHGRGYDYNDASADNDYRGYRDQQQPTSYRTNTRISQGDTRMDQQRRHRMHDTSPGYYDDRRSGYENDMEDHYLSSRQRQQERTRGPRDPPSRPNRYLDTNADYF